MRRWWYALVGLAVISGPVVAEMRACGDEGLTCSDEERCCEHITAYFGSSGAAAPPYIEGKCIEKTRRCGDYWCGNRHCQSGFFGTPSVCCVTQEPDSAASYYCAYSELNCPGNTAQLTIRERTPSRTLQNN